jgi:hypothetical protein
MRCRRLMPRSVFPRLHTFACIAFFFSPLEGPLRLTKCLSVAGRELQGNSERKGEEEELPQVSAKVIVCSCIKFCGFV